MPAWAHSCARYSIRRMRGVPQNKRAHLDQAKARGDYCEAHGSQIAVDHKFEQRRRYAVLRQERLARARALATHTDPEWIALCVEFSYACVQCGDGVSGVTRDHIVPIYQGGSDGIDNIQPLCRPCNSRKGADDFNWIEWRRCYGFSQASSG